MIDIILAGLALTALLVAYPLMILDDLARHPAPVPQGPQPDRGAMTAEGVPYVTGSSL